MATRSVVSPPIKGHKLVAVVVRHGTTQNNEQGLFRGNIDIPLDDKGHQDALTLQARFKNQKFSHAYASDLLRARNTAETILSTHDLKPSLERSLRSWNVGFLSGLPKADHKDDIKFYQTHLYCAIPGGESLAEFRGRVDPFLKKALRQGFEADLPVLIVTHSSNIHELSHLLHNDHTAALVEPGGVVLVTYEGECFIANAVYKPITDADRHIAL